MQQVEQNRRHFLGVLANTFLANLTTSFLWFALVFWVYLETRSVLATSVLGASYMLLMAIMAVPFGMLVDRHHKKNVMVVSQLVTAVMFAAAFAFYLATPKAALLDVGNVAFWVMTGLVLVGAVAESARGIALSTVVTLLIPADERDKANGQVGVVGGLSFAVTSVFSGLAVGLLGMTWAFGIAVALTVASLAHLLTVAIPEERVARAEGVPQPVDFGAGWRAIRRVPGLIWLIIFSTFNNLLGGVFMGLMDPYGLELVSVEVWGILWGVLSFGFMIGGVVVSKYGLGANPLRALLLSNLVMWSICIVFTIRESIILMSIGILVYMALIPIVEAAEQTVLQRVVPFETQGRVFGLAQAFEMAAAPISGFIVGPIAEFWLIPYMRSDVGSARWAWLLGVGESRGIALVFVCAGIAGLAFTTLALLSRPYRILSDAYAAAPKDQPAAAG